MTRPSFGGLMALAALAIAFAATPSQAFEAASAERERLSWDREGATTRLPDDRRDAARAGASGADAAATGDRSPAPAAPRPVANQETALQCSGGDDCVDQASTGDAACAAGDARACLALAAVKLEGRSIMDHALAAGYLAEACDAGAAAGCHDLALMRLQGGRGRARDPETGAIWHKKACALGHAGSCRALAEMHRDGALEFARAEEAARFMGAACLLGDQEACVGRSAAPGDPTPLVASAEPAAPEPVALEPARASTP